MPDILLGGAPHNVRLVTNSRELQYYMLDSYYNVAVRCYPKDERFKGVEEITNSPRIILADTAEELGYLLQSVFVDEGLSGPHPIEPPPRIYAYCLCYLPLADILELRTNPEDCAVRIDIQRLRGDLLGMIKFCEEKDR
eukprot:Blabericola_migrator_1__3722@NODE_2113_length_3251_cov_114_276382_g1338_i0_p4_GENE_NODE_2113_length_3251_cov_114_276382_g1338_i0NODE_2113_length_3251_cov_114_276382_g1338_i0_p4_ORF_typecomplete_len139_score17_56_NODE_2113_length_3251_cov_114_276382_g1338_i07031119